MANKAFFNEQQNSNNLFRQAIRSLSPDLIGAYYSILNQTQAPEQLVVTSMLSALSTACQDFIDVKTPYGAIQPVSLFTLVIAESGERKTTTDNLVRKAIFEYVEEYRSKKKAMEEEAPHSKAGKTED